jgi:hypothetical protein
MVLGYESHSGGASEALTLPCLRHGSPSRGPRWDCADSSLRGHVWDGWMGVAEG